MTDLKTIRLFGIDVHDMNMAQTVTAIDHAIKNKQQLVHNCLNANKVVLIQQDEVLRKSLIDADIVSADGQAVVWASRLFGTPLPGRVPGIDLMDEIINRAVESNYKIYFFGAREDVVASVAEIYRKTFNEEVVAGYRNGYYTKEEEAGIAENINSSGASILFVAIPSPQKEIFIKNYKDIMPNIYLMMGVGGSFDVVAGKVQRAPRWMQNNGLEWLYRLIQEPRKMWRRYLIGNIKYLLLTWRAYWNGSKKGQ